MKIGEVKATEHGFMKCVEAHKINHRAWDSCRDCYFHEFIDCEPVRENYLGSCDFDTREDGKEVIFILVGSDDIETE